MASGHALLLTGAPGSGEEIRERGERLGVELWTVTRGTRDGLAAGVLAWLRARGAGV